MRRIATATLALLAAAAVAAPASAKPIQNTHFSLVTSQGQAGTLAYFSKHETGGRRYLFAQIQVTVTCSDGSSTTGTLTVDGNLDKRDNDVLLQPTVMPVPGVTRNVNVSVALFPKIKGGSKKARGWKRARGAIDISASDSTGSCSSGPVEFSSAIAGRF
jgi:hypothetical protein